MKLIQPNFSWQQFLLSWHGRVPRRQYWILNILLVGFLGTIIAGIIDMSVFNINPNDDSVAPASTFYLLLSLWPSSVIFIKRLHDINLSVWQYCKPLVVALVIAAFGMGLMWLKKDMLQQDETMKTAFEVATAVLAAPFLLYFVWLNLLAMFKRGTEGENRFGPDIRAQIINQTTDTSTKTESDTTA